MTEIFIIVVCFFLKFQIFENGLVSRNLWLRASLCPTNTRIGFYLSVFWVPTDIRKSGTVYYRQEKPDTSSSSFGSFGLDYRKLVKEIRSSAETLGSDDFYTAGYGKKSALTVDDIRSVVVITWERMVQPKSRFANVSFQIYFFLVQRECVLQYRLVVDWLCDREGHEFGPAKRMSELVTLVLHWLLLLKEPRKLV